MAYIYYIIGILGITTVGIEIEVLYIYFTLILIDTLFGIVYYIYRRQFSYVQMCKGFAKKFIAISFFIVVALVLQGADIDSGMISLKWLASMLVISEGYSILGLMYGLLTGEKVNRTDGISLLIKKVYNVFGNLIN